MGRRVLRILALLACGLAVGWWLARPDVDPPGPAQAALDRNVGVIRFRDAPLEQVLRECEGVAGVPIVVDWDAMAQAGVTRRTPVTVHRYGDTLGVMLGRIVEKFPSDTFAIRVIEDADRIVLGGGDELFRRCVVRVYDVADLLRDASWLDELAEEAVFRRMGRLVGPSPPPDDPYSRRRECLVELVVETVDPDSWAANGGTLGDVRYAGDHLLVTQTVENQRTFARVLQQLREADAAPTIWPGPWTEEASWRALLARRAPADVVLDGVPFDLALDHLRETFRVNIEFNGGHADNYDRSLNSSQRVTVRLTRPTLEEALMQVGGAGTLTGEPAAVAYGGDSEVVLCSAAAAADWSSTAVYDLRALLGTAPDNEAFAELISRMKAEVARESWRDHGGNVGAARNGYLGRAVITQTRENHHLIREWLDARLAEVRTPAGKP